MGTTLTGTTPQDTYDSLIKVTDNGPLSGTLKALSDGLGNDSALALSTGAARVTGSLGIGTAPEAGFNLDIVTALGSYPRISGSDQANVRLRFSNGGAGGRNYELIGGLAGANNSNFSIFDATASATRLTIDSTGNVGIGTSSPSTKLTVDNSANGTTRGIDLVGNGSTVKGRLGVFSDGVYLSGNYYFDGAQNNDTSGLGQTLIVLQSAAGSASSILFRTSAAGSTVTTTRASIDADGLKFGSDSAAANALDDYEEGTWTMGVSFGGSSVGVTTLLNTGTYTKIGRQVTVNGYLQLTNKGSSTGSARITGLPFAIANGNSHYGAVTLFFNNITFLNQFQGYGLITTTTIDLLQVTTLGVLSTLNDTNFSNSSEIIVNFTYFV